MALEGLRAAVSSLAYWLVMPAAGVSSRMQAGTGACPKQYLPLAGLTVIERALAPFIDDTQCAGIVVALHADDRWFASLAVAKHIKVHQTVGGATRRDSVLAGLRALSRQGLAQDDWIWVHDAARPCLRRADMERLKVALSSHPAGALLGARVSDTLKRAGQGDLVGCTVPREDLWRAFTPQAFRLGVLTEALLAYPAATDESSAMEFAGVSPRLVAGEADNLKITVPSDLVLAEHILREMSR